jgi:hypothetical protein
LRGQTDDRKPVSARYKTPAKGYARSVILRLQTADAGTNLTTKSLQKAKNSHALLC